MENKDGRGKKERTQENLFMQHFQCSTKLSAEPVFDLILFVYIQKPLNKTLFNVINPIIIIEALGLEKLKEKL